MSAPPSTAVAGSQREQRHRALVDAARALATEHGADGFTVEAVASLAGVSRRTVFNHFAGLDDLLVAVCEQILAEVTTDLLTGLDRLTGDTDGPVDDSAALDAVCEAARGVDLPTAIVTIHHVLGGHDASDERADAISRTAFDHVAGRLRDRLRDRAPALDPLDLELTLTLLTAGIATLARHWLEAHPDLTPDVRPDARTDWDQLLDRLLLRLRAGHPSSREATHG